MGKQHFFDFFLATYEVNKIKWISTMPDTQELGMQNYIGVEEKSKTKY